MVDFEHKVHPAVARIVARSDEVGVSQALGADLARSDMATLLLHVFQQRTARLTAAEVLRQYRSDRFVAPTPVDARRLARVELQALETAAPAFEPVVLAPLAPLGTHFVLGRTPQNNVVTTCRMSEVAADPTSSLALEAAVRRERLLRSSSRSVQSVHLSATQRVTRAQRFDGPRSFAHFSLFGLVSAGRDVGNFGFEVEAVRQHLTTLISVLSEVAQAPLRLRLSPFTTLAEQAVDDLVAEFDSDDVRCSRDPDRRHGRRYYRNICFKLLVESHDEMVEVGDGGDVWWTQDLLQNKKERLVISGLGLERLALLSAEQAR